MRIKLFIVFFIATISLQASWSEYKSLYIAKDGRVIDRANSDITHSEGIGYAMYFAIKNSDFKSFSKIHNWYENNLKKNKFGLISWKWGKDDNGIWSILDSNDATDGDLWIAYDNLLMYEITKNVSYKSEALKLIQSIKKHLLVKQAGSLYLLPGSLGFRNKNSIEINLSYYVFFIFDKFREYDKDEVWSNLKDDGINLLYKARFTSLKLNADWISVDKYTQRVSLSRNHSFGFDAIRIPFNILKSKIKNKNSLLEPYKNYLNAMKSAKSVFGVCDLKSGNISLYDYSYAHLSIYNMLDKYFNKSESFGTRLSKLKGKNKDDYYAYSIYLFTTFNK